MPSFAESDFQVVSYEDNGQVVSSIYCKPSASVLTGKGILILPSWIGIGEHERQVAVELASLGFHAMIADIYGSGRYPRDKMEAAEISGFYKTHVDQYRHRIRLALGELVRAGADADKVIIIGYCFGGTGALEAARANMPVRGVVSFHGGLRRDESRPVGKIHPKVLVLHGEDDFLVPEKDIVAFRKEMELAGADWEMTCYAGAAHAFTDPAAGNDKSTGAAYNQEADRQSWQDFLTFERQVMMS